MTNHNQSYGATLRPSSRSITVSVYHDESGTNQSPLLLHGTLFVPDSHRKAAVEALSEARDGFVGEIHFQKLRDSHMQRARVAQAWLRLYALQLSEHLFFKCLVVDKNSAYYHSMKAQHQSYPYNHSAMLTVWGGVALFYRQYDYLQFSIYSDKRDVSGDDKFTEYVPREVSLRSRNKRSSGGNCPNASTIRPHVVMIDSDPRKVEAVHRDHCEFIQLTDLITSAIAQAINADASNEIKKVAAQTVAEWVQDTNLPSWMQDMNLYQRFSAQRLDDEGFNAFETPITNSIERTLYEEELAERKKRREQG